MEGIVPHAFQESLEGDGCCFPGCELARDDHAETFAPILLTDVESEESQEVLATHRADMDGLYTEAINALRKQERGEATRAFFLFVPDDRVGYGVRYLSGATLDDPTAMFELVAVARRTMCEIAESLGLPEDVDGD